MSDPEGKFVRSNIDIIGYLPNVVLKFDRRDLAAPFSAKEEMKIFISHFRKYIDYSSMRNLAGSKPELIQSVQNALLPSMQKLLPSMQKLLKYDELNMSSKKILNSTDELDSLVQSIRDSDNINKIENFDKVIKEFYKFYVPAVLRKHTGFFSFSTRQQEEIQEEMEKDIESFLRRSEVSGGSRKRRRSSPRKSKKRSSKTTSKGKKKVSKKSKGKKRKSQVKRRSRNNNNNRNHGNH